MGGAARKMKGKGMGDAAVSWRNAWCGDGWGWGNAVVAEGGGNYHDLTGQGF